MAPWTPLDYPETIFGSGRDKLVASRVAPIVAEARGYLTYTAEKATMDAALAAADTKRSAPQGRQFTGSVKGDGGRDALFIPFYSLAQDLDARPASYQLRPSDPGQSGKYLFAKGLPTVIDYHPGQPLDGRTGNGPVWITEGAIKADALLTAHLEAYYSPEALSMISRYDAAKLAEIGVNPALGSTLAARAYLRYLLSNIPADQRATVLSIGGVGSWHKNPEWTMIGLRGRHVHIAFDGDVARNVNVFRQAKELFGFTQKREGIPLLVDFLRLPPGTEPTPYDAIVAQDRESHVKDGIDDFLAAVPAQGFAHLIQRSTEALPPEPERTVSQDDMEVRWRVGDDGFSTETLVETQNHDGTSYYWKPAVRYALRVRRLITERSASEEERLTGELGKGISSEDSIRDDVEIEYQYHGRDDIDVRGRFIMPRVELDTELARWSQKINTPASLILHPQWPPRGEIGSGVAAAMKAYRADEVGSSIQWSQMGWAPREDGMTPAFIVGSQVVDAHSDMSDGASTSVTEATVTGVKNFGVICDTDTTEERHGALRRVVAAFTDGSLYTDPAKGSILMSLGLRPTSPIRPSTVVWFNGSPGSGKSFGASFIFSFWQHRGGIWHEQSLPGSAQDSRASREVAMHVAPIWAIEDLAPTSSRVQAERQADDVDTAIRGVYQKTTRRRATVTANRQLRSSLPNCVLVITAENPHINPSTMARALQFSTRAGHLAAPVPGQKPALVDMRDRTGDQARATGVVLQALCSIAERDGWIDLVETFQGMAEETKSLVVRQLESLEGNLPPGAEARAVGIASDALQGWAALTLTAQFLEMDDAFMAHLEAMRDAMIRHICDDVSQQGRQTPGKPLIEALGSLLQSGSAHISNLAEPQVAPCQADQFRMQALGWSDGSHEPTTPRIGYYTEVRGTGVVVFEMQESVRVAIRAGALGQGTNAKSAWTAAAENGLCALHMGERRGDAMTRRFKTAGGRGIFTGMPVLYDDLFGQTDDEQDEEQ